ncbi:MAG: bifunctional 4-hydroxy-2-oxoglutarate aldolase/2-dehydro-3-deoxy-phosphogluconate aldolase [Sulfurospirillum sp.]|nr:bifunctional 4-hydroxy-2-oxoglutarate aldolase/2-dehydro-3-deoxy-phosphogluconate aldolase [Sulfurospirillum sp.]
MNAREIMSISPIIPVVSLSDKNDAVALAQALYDGGIHILELTLRTPCALEAMELIAKEVPHMYLGAGTVCNALQFRQAIDAGAKFVFSPGISLELLDVAAKTAYPFIPGVASASEIMLAMSAGIYNCKLFPASALGGVALLKAFAGPFGDVKFCPTGGVKMENMHDFLALSNVLAVGGTWLSDTKLIANKEFDTITKLCKQSLQSLKKGGEL